MIKQHFIQAWVQLRQQSSISAVGIVGTMLVIFLIMLVAMMQQVKAVPSAPESNRDHFLHVKWMSISSSNQGDDTSDGPMSTQIARECFQSLKTPETATIYTVFPISTPVSLPGSLVISIDLRQTDDIFWCVFDFSSIDGKPYDEATLDAGQPVVILAESVVRSLFSTMDAMGREFLLDHVPYHVVDIIEDVSTLTDCTYGQVRAPYTSTGMDKEAWNDRHMRTMSCATLAYSRDDFLVIRQEAERRKLGHNTLIGKDEWELIYRNHPYGQEKDATAFSANVESDVGAARHQRIMIFATLLIVPAISPSSMTQSRLHQRVSGVGVRRTFGSAHAELMGQIIAENLVVTLLADTMGLLSSVAFTYMGSTLLFAQELSQTLNPPEVGTPILPHASTLAWALFFCLVLNLMNSGFPAWCAVRIGIVNALGGRLH